MYGFTNEEWEYIWKNIDFTEVFVPSKGGYKRQTDRKKYWEGKGHEVIPYEDKGVSVGIYVLKKKEKDGDK